MKCSVLMEAGPGYTCVRAGPYPLLLQPLHQVTGPNQATVSFHKL